MKNRIPLYMTIAVILGFAIIIGMNFINLLGISQSKYISPNEVRGMAVEHNNILFTLNFDQQNSLVDIFNRSFPVSRKEAEPRMKTVAKLPDVQKIIIYRFDAPDIEIKPVGYVGKMYSQQGQNSLERFYLLFSAPIWNPDGLMEEATQDQIQEILLKTYDP